MKESIQTTAIMYLARLAVIRLRYLTGCVTAKYRSTEIAHRLSTARQGLINWIEWVRPDVLTARCAHPHVDDQPGHN